MTVIVVMELSPCPLNHLHFPHPNSHNTYTTAKYNILHNHPNAPDARN